MHVADRPSTTPAGGVLSAHLQQVGLKLLRVLLEALGEGANQTGCAAFVFRQLNGVPCKKDRDTQTRADKSLAFLLQKGIDNMYKPVLLRTIDSGVGLDEHLTIFLPQQDRIPETQEVVSAAVADGGVALVQSSASVHVRR